jgi:phosphonopyruvate decarboxylase
MPGLTVAQVCAELLRREPSACLVSTCGYTSREIYGAADRPGNFYLVGAMGMAAPVAAGIALTRPGHPVIAVDGDGSLLMNLGVLPFVASAGVPLLHVVADNQMHESTGGQATAAAADFAALALAAGYRSAATVRTRAELLAVGLTERPALLHAITGPRAGAIGPRIRHSPQDIVTRVRQALLTVSAP